MPSKSITRAISQWLKKQILVQHKQGRCTKIVLHHVGTSGKLGPEICVVNVGEFKEADANLNDDDVEQYTLEVESEATQYAEGVGTTQSFALAAFFEEDDEKALSRFAFRVAVDSDEFDNDVASEPATTAGILKQLMRHTEAKERMTGSMLGSVLHTLQRQNEQLSNMVSKMMDDRVEQMEAVEALISGKHAREVEIKEREQASVYKGQLLDNVLALLPAVANKAMGKKILPETTDPIQLQLMKLVETMTEKDVEGMLNSLEDPQKKIAMVEALMLVKQAVDEREANKQRQLSDRNGKAS